jgi:hypothetical protein
VTVVKAGASYYVFDSDMQWGGMESLLLLGTNNCYKLVLLGTFYPTCDFVVIGTSAENMPGLKLN